MALRMSVPVSCVCFFCWKLNFFSLHVQWQFSIFKLETALYAITIILIVSLKANFTKMANIYYCKTCNSLKNIFYAIHNECEQSTHDKLCRNVWLSNRNYDPWSQLEPIMEYTLTFNLFGRFIFVAIEQFSVAFVHFRSNAVWKCAPKLC